MRINKFGKEKCGDGKPKRINQAWNLKKEET